MDALARAISVVETAQDAGRCAVAFRRWAALPNLQARTSNLAVRVIVGGWLLRDAHHDLTRPGAEAA